MACINTTWGLLPVSVELMGAYPYQGMYTPDKKGYETEVIETNTLTGHTCTYLKELTSLNSYIDVYGGQITCSGLNELPEQDDSVFNALTHP